MFNANQVNAYIHDFVEHLKEDQTQAEIFRQLYLSFGSSFRTRLLTSMVHHLNGHYVKQQVMDQDYQVVDVSLVKRLVINYTHYAYEQMSSGVFELLNDFDVLRKYTNKIYLTNLILELGYTKVKIFDKASNRYFTLGSDFIPRPDGHLRFQVTVNKQTQVAKSHREVQMLLLDVY